MHGLHGGSLALRTARAGATLAGALLAATLTLTLAAVPSALAIPAPPIEVQLIAAGDAQIAITWSNPEDPALSGYEVLRDGTPVATTDAHTTSYLDAAPAAGVEHHYSVVALEGAQRSAPSGPPLEARTAASVGTISSCQPTPLASGSYVLASDLTAPPGHPCLTFDSVDGVSLDCNGHRIVNETGPTSDEPAVSLRGVNGFLLVNCDFYNPDPLSRSAAAAPSLAVINESSNGLLAGDTFAVGQGTAAVNFDESTGVSFIADTFLDTRLRAWGDEEGYVGASTLTFPTQAEPRSAIALGNGRANTLDGNSAYGAANLDGTYQGPGADDVVTATNEREDVVVGNHLDSSYDCGYETIGLEAHSYVADNFFDNNWAAAICSYWATSWLGNSVIDNLASYSGALFVIDGGSELAAGETTNYLYDNSFEGNVLSHGAADLFGRSAELSSWTSGSVPMTVGGNSLVGNDFGEATTAPHIEATQPPLVGAASGNECQLPSPDLECGLASETPAQPPSVAGIYPAQGPESRMVPIVIEGSGFTGADEVHFGSQSAKITSVLSDTRLLVEAPPAAAGTVDVGVTTPVATSSVGASDRYTYGAIPVVESVSPGSGPAAGGTPVSITGSGFGGATSVDFGSSVERPCGSAPCFTVNSPTSITATSRPAPAPERYVNVTVSTPAGTSVVTEGILSEALPALSDRFEYIPTPVVSDVTPSAAPEAGGTTVTIAGSNLKAASAVLFGGIPATSVTIKSASELTAVAPAHAGAGVVDVTVATPGGTSAGVEADHFTYGPPAVTAVHPAGDVEAGGRTVTISGARFQEVAAVHFGSIPATNVNVQSGNVITVAAPSHSAGKVPITVTTSGGTSAEVPAGEFSYVAGRPVVSAVHTSGGPEAGGTKVTISGQHFEAVEAVDFGLSGANAEVRSPTEISATAPAGTGTVNVSVVNPVNTSAVSSGDRYAYSRAAGLPPPTISRLQSNAGPVGGGTRVMITGANLQGASAVAFGTQKATSYTVLSASTISAVSPSASGTGEVDVRVTTTSGQNAISPADRFTYRRSGTPVAWGSNEAGQLGAGVGEGSPLAVQASGSGEALAVSGGEAFTLALMANRTVEAYGENSYGELGDGNTQSSAAPVAVTGLSGVGAIAAGARHALALEGGRVLAWGENQYGQLGDGTTETRKTPVEVKGLGQPVTAIAAGGSQTLGAAVGSDFSLALLSNGTVEAWGNGASGQLGDGSWQSSAVPVEVKGLREVVAIAAGDGFALALRRDGSVEAWGAGSNGQLGDGATGNVSEPVAVAGLGTVSAIAAGGAHALALLADGTIKDWGWNFAGQLGDGASAGSDVPVLLANPTEAVALAAGDSHSLALLANGDVQAWGENGYGQLGDALSGGPEGCAFATCARSPVSVEELGAPGAIGAGAHESLAVGTPPPRVSAVQASAGPETGGTSVTISGGGFEGASEVRFGQTSVPFTVTSQGTINATSPAGVGRVDVTVSAPGGTSRSGTGDQFSYLITAPLQGIRFNVPVPQPGASELELGVASAGFSFGPLVVGGAAGEAARVELQTHEPAFLEAAPSHYRAIGGGVNVELEGRNSSGERLFGPILITCSVPTSVVLARIPIEASPEGGEVAYSASYTADCVIAPGVLDGRQAATIVMTATGPAAAAPGQSLTLANAGFTIALPREWTELLRAVGTTSIRGTARSSATATISG